MRTLAIALALGLPTASLAWDFTPGQPCLLTHESGSVDVALTYDPTGPLYTISLTQAVPFPDAPTFALAFAGDRALQIGTGRHLLTSEGRTLTVTDSGFGNVLDGLQFNRVMTALIGDQQLEISLQGAADPVAAFRKCEREVPTS